MPLFYAQIRSWVRALHQILVCVCVYELCLFFNFSVWVILPTIKRIPFSFLFERNFGVCYFAEILSHDHFFTCPKNVHGFQNKKQVHFSLLLFQNACLVLLFFSLCFLTLYIFFGQKSPICIW